MYLTSQAALYIDRVRRGFELPASAGVRISQHPGPAGHGVEVMFVDAPLKDDVIVQRAGARIFLDAAIAPTLAEAVLDLDRSVDPPGLLLRSARLWRGQDDGVSRGRPFGA